jgi:purine-binding chemotaxis protein CheW
MATDELNGEHLAVSEYLNSLLSKPNQDEPVVDEVVVEKETPLVKPPTVKRGFMCFRVGKLLLGVPRSYLAGVQVFKDGVEPVAQAPNWVMGSLLDSAYGTMVVETATLVAGERQTIGQSMPAKQLIMLNESRLALTCDEIVGGKSIEESAIRWRQEAGKRPWMAGMVPEISLVLLDVEYLLNSLGWQTPGMKNAT